MEHNRWLNWKLNHGLAYRGRPAPLRPKGALAFIMYHLYFRFKEDFREETTNAVALTYHQDVGGTLGPSGKTNGE